MTDRSETPNVIEVLAHYLLEHADDFSQAHTLNILAAVAGDRVSIVHAKDYVFTYARSSGYDIPPYPFDAVGEIRQFFADQNVSNVAEWYERIGLSPHVRENLSLYDLVVVKNASGAIKAFPLPAALTPSDAFLSETIALVLEFLDSSDEDGRSSTR